tara:strand:+ start:80 stop:478 length:399 start_codon:yes stop_codon:yes gene_type:complete
MSNSRKDWLPEIMYEDGDEGGLTSNIPFIMVPDGEEMPKLLYIFESRDTGEIEPGPDGEELPVTELDLHQYVDMSILKQGLTGEQYDVVRKVLGLEPLRKAEKAGHKITEEIRNNIETLSTKANDFSTLDEV